MNALLVLAGYWVLLLLGVEYGYRTDVGTLQPAKRMADGRLVADAHITRPGIFEYSDQSFPGGIRRELREDEEVYNQDTLDSMANLPITAGHPPKLLTADTAKKYMVGSTGDVAERDADHVKAKVMIADAPTIARMDRGAHEVSLGYKADIHDTPGIHPKYGRYDVVQKNIRGNHLAVAIGSARAGRLARVRMDDELTAAERDNMSAGEFAYPAKRGLPIGDKGHALAAMSRFNQEDFSADPSAKKTAFNKIVAAAKKFGVDSTNFEKEHGGRFDADDHQHHGGSMDPDKLKEALRSVESDLKAALANASQQKERADSAETARDEERGKISVLEKDVANLRSTIAAGATAVETSALTSKQERIDELESTVSRFDETFTARVRARTTLERQAGSVMGDAFRMDDMNDRSIMVAVVQRLDATEKIGAEISDGVVAGKFEMAVKGFKRNARSLANAQSIMSEVQNTGAARADSKDEKLKAFRDQWKQPLPNDLRAKKGA